MNNFREGLTRYMSKENLERIRKLKVGIAGAGGLGSNCAMHLVRSGFEHLTLVDHDRVEPSNLNRQFFFVDQIGKDKVVALQENLKRINRDLSIQVFTQRIDHTNVDSFFGECEVIVEAFDDPQAKKMLVEHYYSSGKFVVAASGIAGCGNSDAIQIKEINPNLFIVGDFISEVTDNLPPYSPGVAIAAAKQADLILSYAMNYNQRGNNDFNGKNDKRD